MARSTKTIKVVRTRPRKSARGHANPEPADMNVVRELPEHLATNREYMEKEGFELYKEPVKPAKSEIETSDIQTPEEAPKPKKTRKPKNT